MAFPPPRIQFKLSYGNMTITYLVQEVLPPIYKKSILWQYNHNIWCDEMPLPVSKITES